MNISEEIIDLYVRGELNGSQLDSFNAALAADPQLQIQVSFQKKIVQSINTYRHQQLKNRLNSIPVKPVAGPFHLNATKIAASLTAVIILLGSYAIYKNQQPIEITRVSNNAITETNLVKSQSSELNATIQSSTTTKISSSNENRINNNSALDGPLSATKASEISLTQSKQKNNALNSKKTKTLKDQPEYSSQYSDPQMETDLSIEDIQNDFDMPNLMADGKQSSISAPQIKVNIVKENNLGYRFYNNQLFLHGNFTNSTYELLELNNKPSKQLFLYFESHYYELIQGKTKTTPLAPILDSTVLIQLNQLREH